MKNLLSLIFSGFLLFGCNSGTTFSLKNLPTDFTQLTRTDSGLFVLNTCEWGNLQIKVSDNSLLMHGIQEDFNYQIINSVIDKSDTIRLFVKNSETGKDQIFRIKNMDNDSGLFYWVTKFPAENDGALPGNVVSYLLASDNKLKLYKRITEPCEEEEF